MSLVTPGSATRRSMAVSLLNSSYRSSRCTWNQCANTRGQSLGSRLRNNIVLFTADGSP
jgi:hypothetical protein